MLSKDELGWYCDPEEFQKSVKYFSLQEMCRSRYLDDAMRAGINPEPDGHAIEALRMLCVHVLDPLRMMWQAPIIINSGYRCEWINKKVGGAVHSQHIRGQAADIRAFGHTGARYLSLNRMLLGAILHSGMSFDQLIAEGCDRNGYPLWLHISFVSKTENRHQLILKYK